MVIKGSNDFFLFGVHWLVSFQSFWINKGSDKIWFRILIYGIQITHTLVPCKIALKRPIFNSQSSYKLSTRCFAYCSESVSHVKESHFANKKSRAREKRRSQLMRFTQFISSHRISHISRVLASARKCRCVHVHVYVKRLWSYVYVYGICGRFVFACAFDYQIFRCCCQIQAQPMTILAVLCCVAPPVLSFIRVRFLRNRT